MAYSDKYEVNVSMIKNAVNFHLRIKEEVPNPILLIESFFQSPDTGKYNVELMNRTIDVCLLYGNVLYEPLAQIVYKIIQEYGDVPKSCPIKAVRIYVLSYNISLNLEFNYLNQF